MDESTKKYRGQMTEWADIMEGHILPDWDDLPQLELYMDQVVILAAQYMSHLGPMLGEEKPVTPAMINNYVKMGLIAPPVKKRYRRSHLACIIIICLLKRSLTMAAIQKLMTPHMPEQEVEHLYRSFRRNRSIAIEHVVKQVHDWDGEIFRSDEDDDDAAFVIRLAVMANLFKTSAEKLVGASPDPKDRR